MKLLNNILVVVFAIVVVGCWKGGGGGISGGGSSNLLSGVAASGAPISGTIYLKDSKGTELSESTSDGTYSFTLDGLTPPFMLKAVWNVNNQQQNLYSVASKSGTANITPLTQVIVMAAAKSTSLDSIYAGSTNGLQSVVSAIPAAVTEVLKTLNPLLTQFGQSGMDPITGTFAANHTGMDALLDSVDVSATSGNISVSDKLSGSLILQAPVAHVSNGLQVPDWTDQDAFVGYHPDVAVDVYGNGLVAWSEIVGSQQLIRARFLDGSGTTSTSTVNVSTLGDSQNPRLVFDGSGNAIMVWEQYQNSMQTIWASRYLASVKTWSTPQQISDANPAGQASGPSVALDNAGNAIAVWTEGTGVSINSDVWVARYDVATNSWVAPAIISDNTHNASNGQVAVNAAGQGIVAWLFDTMNGVASAPPVDIYARSITTAGVMGGSQTRINSVPASSLNWVDYFFSVAMDASGNGAALFVQNSGATGYSDANAAMYTASGGWQPSSVIVGGTSAAAGFRFPLFSFDSVGNAFAVWYEMPVSGGTVVAASRYTAGSGWGAPETVSSNIPTSVYAMDPHFAIDGIGNATVLWYEYDPANSVEPFAVKSSRYLIDTGWSNEILISKPTNMGPAMLTCPWPRVGSNAVGQTLTIWGYSDTNC